MAAPLDDLRAAYESGDLIVLAGDGVSAAGGLPTWKDLAILTAARLTSRGADARRVAEVEDDIRRERYIDALLTAQHVLGRNELAAAIEESLDDRGREIPEVACAIAALKRKLRAVFTTTLDRFLERAFGGAWPAFVNPPGDLAQRTGFILKLNGTLLDRSTWVLASHDREAFGSPRVQAPLSAFFYACPILFVGCDLDIDDLARIRGSSRVSPGERPPRHFALLPGPVTPYRRRSLEDAGVQLLLYDNADGRHAELPRILRSLELDGPPRPIAKAPPAGARRAPDPTDDDYGGAARSRAAVNVFLSYSDKDQGLVEELTTHLALLHRQGFIQTWHKRRVGPGEGWRGAVDEHMSAARVILLLLSADFLASDYCYDVELARALERSDAGEAEVVPILLRACDWRSARFKTLRALPRNEVPISSWSNRDEAWSDVIRELRAILSA